MNVSVCLFICAPTYIHIHLSIHLYVSVCLCICLPIYLSVRRRMASQHLKKRFGQIQRKLAIKTDFSDN
jgi:hypothetical protein